MTQPKNQNIKKLTKSIDADKDYSIHELYTIGFFFWLSSYQGARLIVKKNLKLFKPLIVKHGKKTSYFIKGKNALEYVEKNMSYGK